MDAVASQYIFGKVVVVNLRTGDFATGLELFPALENYFHFYNHQRPHQALGYRTPADLFPHKAKRKRSLS